MQTLASWFAELTMDGWADTVASHVSEFVAEQIRRRLFERHKNRDCEAIAALARSLLEGKKQLHELVGTAAGAAVNLLSADEFSQAVTYEFASRIPLPVDQPAAHVARALQMTGIATCVVNAVPLDLCPCFVDLALTEAQDRAKVILTSALDEWASEQSQVLRAWAQTSSGRATPR